MCCSHRQSFGQATFQHCFMHAHLHQSPVCRDLAAVVAAKRTGYELTMRAVHCYLARVHTYLHYVLQQPPVICSSTISALLYAHLHQSPVCRELAAVVAAKRIGYELTVRAVHGYLARLHTCQPTQSQVISRIRLEQPQCGMPGATPKEFCCRLARWVG
jgi:hypothetical protein